MLYYFEKDRNAVQSFHDLNKFFDEGTINKSQEKQFKKFKSGDIKLADEEEKEFRDFWFLLVVLYISLYNNNILTKNKNIK